MLNSRLKKDAFDELKVISEQYALQGEIVQKNSINLLEIRKGASQKIKSIEENINQLANTPKEFEATFSKVHIYLQKFQSLMDIQYNDKKANQINGGLTGAGVVVGAGVAAFGPTAAIAVATTFGTASTGTAISALSGAAATNAALAWLGGGTLALGGGGMAAGNTLLALAGPVGWTIGGSALLGGALIANKKNKDSAVKAQKETVEVSKQLAVLNAANVEIKELVQLTTDHSIDIMMQQSKLIQNAPSDYNQFTLEQKQEIGSLVNNTLSLSKLINKKVGK